MADQTLFGDTIFALSSGAPPSGVAIIRLSGSRTGHVLKAMVGCLPAPRKATLARIRDSEGVLLDTGLVLFFPGPASVTGEDCGELHVHGGRAVVAAVLEALSAFAGVRQAEAGEFTRRAFLSGKLDLAGAEALSDLIAAETEAQRRFAMTNAEGRHRALYDDWRKRLLHARAMTEAALDFADEEDIPEDVAERVREDLDTLCREIEAHAGSYRQAEIIREGFRVVILGAPNAGKSSLLNALAARDIAIVTEEAGTTRDALETVLDVGGMKVIVTDTAGLRQATGRVEAIGIARALDHAETADLRLLLEDMAAPVAVDLPAELEVVRVGSKADLAAPPPGNTYAFAVSAVTGEGIRELVAFVGAEAARRAGRADILPFRLRHVDLLREAAGHIRIALTAADMPPELQAEELRLAADRLGRICGTIGTEDVLAAIFSNFCIGK